MVEENPNIVVKEIRGEKKVGFSGLKYIEDSESELRQLVEEWKETIIALHEADELDTPEREWKFGRIVEERVETGDNLELKQILNYSTLDIAQSYDLKIFRNFYNMFPEGDFNKELSWALYRDMLVDKRLDEFHDVYDHIVEDIPDDETVRTYEYRAYLNADDYKIISVVQALYDLGKGQTSGLTLQKATEGVRHIRAMAGESTETVSEETVNEIIRKHGFNE